MSTFGMGSGMTDANAMERIMQLKRIQRRTGTLAMFSLLFWIGGLRY